MPSVPEDGVTTAGPPPAGLHHRGDRRQTPSWTSASEGGRMSTRSPAGAEPSAGPPRERRHRFFQGLQKTGRGLRLPIAVLPAAGALNRLGRPDVFGEDGLGWTDASGVMVGAGGALLDGSPGPPPLFCVGVRSSAWRRRRTGRRRWRRWRGSSSTTTCCASSRGTARRVRRRSPASGAGRGGRDGDGDRPRHPLEPGDQAVTDRPDRAVLRGGALRGLPVRDHEVRSGDSGPGTGGGGGGGHHQGLTGTGGSGLRAHPRITGTGRSAPVAEFAGSLHGLHRATTGLHHWVV